MQRQNSIHKSTSYTRLSRTSISQRFSRASQSSAHRSLSRRESTVARVRNSIRRISTVVFDNLKEKNAKTLSTLDESIEDSPWSQNRWRPPAWDCTERRTLAEVLTQVPNYIIDRGDAGGGKEAVSYVNGVVMFTDLSGFTSLCEKYAESDDKPANGERNAPRGVDALTASLNDYLGRIVQDLMCANGDILKFAGDAILTLWESEPENCPATIDKVVTAAINIQCKMDNYMTEVGVNLRVKIGIAVGTVIFYHIANDNERHFGEAGPTIQEVNIAQSSASSGTVVITPKAWDLLEQKLFCYNILESGFVEINRRSSLSKTLQTFMDTRDPKSDFFIHSQEPECLRLAQLNKVSEQEETIYRMYTNQNVISKLDACAELRWLSEIRTVTVMFLEVLLKESADNHKEILSTIQQAFTIIYDQMTRMLGTINKLYMFDKGCTFLIIFGMPGKKHEDEPTRALKAADNIMKDFHTHSIEASIGITTGRAFCGIIGHPQRHEYGVIGKSVNLAARLMSYYPKRIACDDNTRTLSNLDPQDFHQLPYIPMKGVPENSVHYEYRIDRRKDRLFSTFIPPQQIEDECGSIIGREEEMKMFERQLAHLEQIFSEDDVRRIPVKSQSHDHDNDTAEQVKSIVIKIESATGMGKTRILQEMKHVAERRKFKVVFAAAGAVEHATPHFAIKSLLVQMFRLMECHSAQERADVIISFVEDEVLDELYLLNDLLKITIEKPYHKRPREKDKKKMLTNMICYLFQKATSEQKMVIILDDAQWIDKHSWIMLFEIIKRCKALIVCSTRPFPAAQPMMEEAKRILNASFTKEMHLSSLKPDDMVMLACQLIKVTRLPIQLINILRNRSHGVPLYAEQLVSTMLQFKVLQVQTMSNMRTAATATNNRIINDTIQEIPGPAYPHMVSGTPSGMGPGGNCAVYPASGTRQNRYFSITPRPQCKISRVSTSSTKRLSLMSGAMLEGANRINSKTSKDGSDIFQKEKKQYHSIPEIQASTEKLECKLSPNADLSEVPIKDSVTGVILTRIDQLSPINQMVLKSASVLGRKFHYETLQAITPNIREASLGKALKELVDAKIIERCQEDRLSVAFFRNRRHDSLPPLRGQNMSYTFTHSILQETTYGILCADQRRVLHEGAAEHLQLRLHKCGECGCGKFLQNPLGPRNPSSGVAFIGAAHGLSLLGRSQLEHENEADQESDDEEEDDDDVMICHLDDTDTETEKSGATGTTQGKKVTIGKTITFPLARRTTLLGDIQPSSFEVQGPARGRPSLASVKLEAKYQNSKPADNLKKNLIVYKKHLYSRKSVSAPVRNADNESVKSDGDSGTGSGICSDEEEEEEEDKTCSRKNSSSDRSVFSSRVSSGVAVESKDSDIDTMTSGQTNMDMIEDWVLNRDRCHCRVVIRELIPTIVRHWKAANNEENLLSVMIEAVSAAVYMGDSEEAFHWSGQIKQRQEKEKIELTRMQDATLRYLEGQAHFKNSQISDAIESYIKSLKLLGVSQPSNKLEAHMNLGMYVVRQLLDDKFQLKRNDHMFHYVDAERSHIIIQCLGRLRIAHEVQHRSVMACSVAVDQFKHWNQSPIMETSMKLETMANFIHSAHKYSLGLPYHHTERRLENIMEFEALAPDNSMALFYAYLLLTETKISEGCCHTGIEHGSNALLLSDGMKHRLLFVSASPCLTLGFLLTYDTGKMIDTLKNMNRFAVEISDNEGQAWFVAYAMFLETELEIQIENPLMYREFVFSSVSNADFTNDSIARYCMLIAVALSFARQGNAQRAIRWVTVARTLAPPEISSLNCAFFNVLLCETLILLYQMGVSTNTDPPINVKRRLNTCLKTCIKHCEVYRCLKPRVYTYLSLISVLRRKYRHANKMMSRASYFAELYEQKYDIFRIKNCKREWLSDVRPKSFIGRVMPNKKVHTLLVDEEIEHEQHKIYTVPMVTKNTSKYSVDVISRCSGTSSDISKLSSNKRDKRSTERLDNSTECSNFRVMLPIREEQRDQGPVSVDLITASCS